MSSNQRRHGWDGPVAVGSMQVRVAYASAMHLDETFAGFEVLRLSHRNVRLDLDFATGFLNDGGLLDLGDLYLLGGGDGRFVRHWCETAKVAREEFLSLSLWEDERWSFYRFSWGGRSSAPPSSRCPLCGMVILDHWFL